MTVTALVENRANIKGLECVHGLSFYIETHRHKLLFDLGPGDTLLHNADRLGIDLAAVDTVVLSHGHYDHGGGLPHFMQRNHRAVVYMTGAALGAYYYKKMFVRKYIGLDQALGRDRFVFTGLEHRIDRELFLFSGVDGGRMRARSNRGLTERREDGYRPDAFAHEQSLVIRQGEVQLLLGGCAHCGIVNILEEARRREGNITHLISGFHLMSPTESKALIRAVADALGEHDTLCHTCHCTGMRAYQLMKERMGEQLAYIATGQRLVIP